MFPGDAGGALAAGLLPDHLEQDVAHGAAGRAGPGHGGESHRHVDGVHAPRHPAGRDAVTGETRVEYTDVVTDSKCLKCDTIPVPGERSYYIVAVNRSGPEERESAPSNTLTAECPIDRAVVHGYLQTAVDSLCLDYTGGYEGLSVTLTNTLDPLFTYSATSDADGYFYIEDIEPGDYTIAAPDMAGGSGLITRSDGTTCTGTSIGTFTATLEGGDVIEYKFGYQ